MNETIKTIIRHVLFTLTIAVFLAFIGLLFGGVDLAMELLFSSSSLAMMPIGKALNVEECIALAEFNTGLGRLERDIEPIILENAQTWLRDLVEGASVDTLDGSYNDKARDFVQCGGAYVFSVIDNEPEEGALDGEDLDETMDADHYMERSVALAMGYGWE